jgi:sulfur-oxidizing protein SoxZ
MTTPLRDFIRSQTRPDTINDIASLIGKTPTHGISPFRPVRESEITGTPLVKRDAIVQLRYAVPGMEITTPGQVITQGARGDVIEVRTMIAHPMETGYRFDVLGTAVPKNVIHTLTVDYAGQRIFKADMSTGVSANPFLSFYTRATESADLLLAWSDDKGQQGRLVVPVVLA